MKFSITEYRSIRDPLPIFHNNKKIQEVQWNQKVFLRAYTWIINTNYFFYFKICFLASTDVAKFNLPLLFNTIPK